MVSSLEGWFNLPKSVKILDISLLGYSIVLFVAVFLYLNFFDRTVQNLMPIFLVAFLLVLTWNFRSQLTRNPDLLQQKSYLRTWFIVSSLIILVIGILILVYPVTY